MNERKNMYYLFETHQIGEYKSKKEALQDADNQGMWYPENNYFIRNEKGENVNPNREED